MRALLPKFPTSAVRATCPEGSVENPNSQIFGRMILRGEMNVNEISYYCYEDTGLERHQLEEIILVHGTTNNSKIKTTSRDNFDGKESNKSFNPEQTTAYGVAV